MSCKAVYPDKQNSTQHFNLHDVQHYHLTFTEMRTILHKMNYRDHVTPQNDSRISNYIQESSTQYSYVKE